MVAFARTSAAESVIVALNVSDQQRDVDLSRTAVTASTRWQVAVGTHRPAGREVDIAAVVLAPLEALVVSRQMTDPGRRVES